MGHGLYGSAKGANDSGRLHVVGSHDDELVARRDQPPQHNPVSFGAAIGDLHVLGRCAIVERGDDGSQLRSAVGLGIGQVLFGEGVAVFLPVRQLVEPQRMHAAFGDIPGDPVFPNRLQAFERERLEIHARGRV